MKRENVMNCSFSRWYPLFHRCTLKSKVIKLPNDFIEYLLEDGVVLPSCAGDEIGLGHNGPIRNGIVDGGPFPENTNDGDDWSDCDDDLIELPSFPQLQREVEEAITELGGAVFPKLNWSCPKDASWISPDGTLKCTTFSDICLLLKSSDFIVHDLTKAFDCCEDCTDSQPSDGFELVLRKWTEISPASEFRCFVRKNKLIAVTQRDSTNHYEFLIKSFNEIHSDITKFYQMKIESKFLETSFVFDVYRYGDSKIKLIDINPFSPVTDPLLFTWQELRDGLNDREQLVDENQGELRLTPLGALQPSPFLSYQLPKDVIDVASRGDINKLVDYLEFKKSTQDQCDSVIPN